MRRVIVWVSGPRSAVAHREAPGTEGDSTGCGLWIGNSQAGFWIDWRNLNPKRVRLCQKCWSPMAVKLAADLPNLRLPPCELAL